MVALAAADIAPVSLRIGSTGEGCLRCAGLRDAYVRLRGQNERLSARVKELEGTVEELRRAAKRQAAPFSREREEMPRRPGRRPGSEYGTKAHRRPPVRVDEELEAPTADR